MPPGSYQFPDVGSNAILAVVRFRLSCIAHEYVGGFYESRRPRTGVLGNGLPFEAGSIYDLVGHSENGAAKKNMKMRGAGKAAQFAGVPRIGSSVPARVYILFADRRRAFDPDLIGLSSGDQHRVSIALC